MSKTSLFLIAILFITLITLLVVNTMYSPQPVLRSIAPIFPTKPAIASENTLSMTPNAVIAPAGIPTNISVVIDSKGELPSVIQMELAYDPDMIAAVSLTPGAFFSNPEVLLNRVDPNNGRISYAIAPSDDQTTFTGSNTVATITVTPRINSYKRATTLSFLPKTLIRTKTAQNTLKTAYGATITLFASSSGEMR